MKTLCKLLGGSRLYHLNNENSDIDYRGVFCNTEISKILGLERFDSQCKQSEECDSVFYEIRHFLSLLRNTNTQVLEILYAPNDCFLEKSIEFDFLRQNKEKLTDTKKLFSSLMGYMNGERRLISGERKGQIGKKRYQNVQKYGYSNKNATNFLRLGFVGIEFFKNQRYVTDCREFDDYELILDIKNNPQNFNLDFINKIMDTVENKVKTAFDNRNKSKDLVFDMRFANEALLMIYKNFIRIF